jgi:hypothetical protein
MFSGRAALFIFGLLLRFVPTSEGLQQRAFGLGERRDSAVDVGTLFDPLLLVVGGAVTDAQALQKRQHIGLHRLNRARLRMRCGVH